MKGIILAGGSGQRLHPLTRITNKHLLPVYDRPMIYFAIEQLAGAGIDRIMIVTGGNHAGEFLQLLGNGSAFGLRHLDYAYQERAGGIGEALGLTEWFAAGDPIAVLLGDNIFQYSISGIVDRFQADPHGARIVLAEVDNPSAYGVADLQDGRIRAIIEKPKRVATKLGLTGAVAQAVAPNISEFVLNQAYRLFPDSPAARGISDEQAAEEERNMPKNAIDLARRLFSQIFSGVHW